MRRTPKRTSGGGDVACSGKTDKTVMPGWDCSGAGAMTSTSAAILNLYDELKAANEDPDCKCSRLINIFEYWRLRHSSYIGQCKTLRDRLRDARRLVNKDKLYAALMDAIKTDMGECASSEVRALMSAAVRVSETMVCVDSCGMDPVTITQPSPPVRQAANDLFMAAVKYTMVRHEDRHADDQPEAKHARV